MKAIFFVCLAALVAVVCAWDKEDHEIFDLVSAVEASEGKGTTFYSWLDIPSTSTTQEIAKAYRKMSMQLHPDKNRGDPLIHERFSRLGVVSTILRNAESRKRYDFFYKNGVPKWRGTGYYYSRFRPGLGSVFVFLVILTSALQYLVQSLNYKRDLGRIENIISDARLAAWGKTLVPTEGQRKVRVNLGNGPVRDEDGHVVSKGRTIDLVVDGQNTYVVDPSGDLEPLDASSAIPPRVLRTWFFASVTGLYHKFASTSPVTAQEDTEDTEPDSDTSSGTSGTNGIKSPPTSKAGGRRRKSTKRR